jgi:hypothetical protein
MKPWKVRKFFGDVVYDLRNRGLLPVVGLLLVAIVAIPVVITRGGSSSSAPVADPAAVQDAVASAPEAQSAVVAYEPGLRKYQDRLDRLSPKDPFKQHFSAAVEAATELSGTVSGGDTGGATGTTTSTDVSGDTGGGGGGSGTTKSKKKKGKKKKAGVVYSTYQTDVMVGEAAGTLQSLTNVAPLTALPSDGAPVLIYLGPNTGGNYALFLVSDDATQPTGAGVCIPKPEDCSVLALAPGQTEDLTYSVDGKVYRIQVVALRRVNSPRPPS